MARLKEVELIQVRAIDNDRLLIKFRYGQETKTIAVKYSTNVTIEDHIHNYLVNEKYKVVYKNYDSGYTKSDWYNKCLSVFDNHQPFDNDLREYMRSITGLNPTVKYIESIL